MTSFATVAVLVLVMLGPPWLLAAAVLMLMDDGTGVVHVAAIIFSSGVVLGAVVFAVLVGGSPAGDED